MGGFHVGEDLSQGLLGCDTLSGWRWRQHGPAEHWYPTTMHSVTTQTL